MINLQLLKLEEKNMKTVKLNEEEIHQRLEIFTKEIESIKTKNHYFKFQKRFQDLILNPSFQEWDKEKGESDLVFQKFLKAYSRFINETIKKYGIVF